MQLYSVKRKTVVSVCGEFIRDLEVIKSREEEAAKLSKKEAESLRKQAEIQDRLTKSHNQEAEEANHAINNIKKLFGKAE